MSNLNELRKLIQDKDRTEITRHKGEYWILHICKNNVPVPLYHDKNADIIKSEIIKNKY